MNRRGRVGEMIIQGERFRKEQGRRAVEAAVRQYGRDQPGMRAGAVRAGIVSALVSLCFWGLVAVLVLML